ncbi:MAG: rubrerythrin family protein [Bacteroidales bacterium]
MSAPTSASPRLRVCLAVAMILLAAFAASGPRAAAKSADQTTLKNLMAAFNGESNAHAKYVEFARKADQEGYAGAAALFRAAAAAEQIHAKNHAAVIEKLGGTPKADVKLPAIKSTADNLQAALEGETYERDTMYPDFIKQATAVADKDAIRTFKMAVSAEAEHAAFYKAAAQALPTWKGAKAFYVCPVCGKTVTTVDFAKCPVCFTEKDKFNKIG